jgi:hypothetical protein
LGLSLYLVFFQSDAAAAGLSAEETRRIGQKIWQNECNGTVSGLTSWNQGENFASLGIGHFIWYPSGVRGPFQESFPNFVNFASNRGEQLPKGLTLTGACPWMSRDEFEQSSQTPQMKELRAFLSRTVNLQADFMVERLRESLPRMLAEAGPTKQQFVKQRFDEVSKSSHGWYALVDYVNFKGEGVLATERYAGQGWGLLQVLEGMAQQTKENDALRNFADSARNVLKTRVRNAPANRNEAKWLPGWLSRINTYH